MANTIIHKQSSVAAKVPLSGDLQQGELAINTTDKKIYTKDSGGSVVELGAGGGGGSSATYATKTTTYTASAGDLLLGDTSGAVFTITLPITPSNNDSVTVRGVGGSVSANNLTVARNGSNIIGLAEDYVIDVDNFEVNFVYNGASRGWEI